MATPASVSVMLLSVLVTDSLSGVDERLYDWMGLRAQHMSWETGKLKDGHCELTGERTLFRAMQAILAGRGVATMPQITVQRQTNFVKLTDVDPNNHCETWFGSHLGSHGIVHNVEFSRLFDLQCELEILQDGNRS
ncbi:MAG: hypothetical protein OJF48_001928 [Afipia sp.]|nr:MAG: hypothetical protein OJF48_001928 [Afipia sp.]